jgi:hypothetical protein
LTAFVADRYGRRCIRRERIGPASEPLDLGRQVAEDLMTAGGAEILQELAKR